MEAIETRPGWPSRSHTSAWPSARPQQSVQSELFGPELQHLGAQLQVGRLGALRFAHAACRGNAVERIHAPGTGAETTSDYTLIVQLEGHGSLSQYGQHAELAAGELALSDNGAPFRHRIEPGSTLLLLRVPAKTLRSHLPSPEQFCGRRVMASGGMTAVAASLTRSLCGQAQAGLPADVHECLSRQLLETVALAFTHALGPYIASSAVVGGRYARARLFIEQNLSDPELGPHSVAQALNVSARYLRMIFAREGECISSYVLRRRLEETARQLTDPRWRGRSICEIAFAWGFNSAPHFSRSFREHYGMPPREYRARQAPPDGRFQPEALAAAS